MVAEPPDDPDYYSLWPRAPSSYESVSGDTATVDLQQVPRPGAEAETAAVQELVYTVTANDTVREEGATAGRRQGPPSGHDDWSKPVARAPMMDVQGLDLAARADEGATHLLAGGDPGLRHRVRGQRSAGRSPRTASRSREGTTQGGANGEFGEFSRHGRARPRHLRDPRLRGLRRGRLPDPRRHQDVHRQVAAVSASGGCGTAGRRPRRCPPSRCAAPCGPRRYVVAPAAGRGRPAPRG